MGNLFRRWGDFWEKIRESPARIPSRVAIPRDHVDKGEELGTAFRPDQYYFEVNVNEMYLTYSRQWFSTYDPMVLAVSEFNYQLTDKAEMQAVPYVVGPAMLEKKIGQKLPLGMICSDTRVAGLHPYRGGRLALTVVLYRVRRESYARKLLQIVESAANVLDFATAVTAYLKVADVVLDGVEALIGSEEDVQPLIGVSRQFRPKDLEPGYFALIDMPEEKLDPDELWVRDRQLVYGKSLADAKAFRDAEYVLYSIAQTPERTDVDLPFYPQWGRVVREASKATPEGWESAKANMSSLYQTMMLSPDLTRRHSHKLTEMYVAEMKRLHDDAIKMAELGPEEEPSELDKIRKQSIDILRM